MAVQKKICDTDYPGAILFCYMLLGDPLVEVAI